MTGRETPAAKEMGRERKEKRATRCLRLRIQMMSLWP